MSKPKAPKHLQAATKRWFNHVVAEWPDLEQHHVRLLTIAAETWDRLTQAREVIADKGLTFDDRFGTPRARPEVAIERDCKTAFMRAIRELDLDIEDPTQPGRPHALRSNRG